MAADLVIFDEKTVADRATFEKPKQYPAGIDCVIVNGQVVIEKGNHSGAKSGKVLRSHAAKSL
ncbi:MAG TPA: D-aminoacylase, partial [Blastocatellia bacterium]